MSDYELVPGDDPILHNEVPKFDFGNPPTDPIELADELARIMIEQQGYGLSANQLGLPYRVCAITGDPILVMYNPRIVDVSEEQVYHEEGCLSYKGLIVKIKRPVSIRVRYTQPNGNTVTEKYTGLTARVIQHEIDHLNGIVFYERANRMQKERAFRKWKAWKRRQK